MSSRAFGQRDDEVGAGDLRRQRRAEQPRGPYDPRSVGEAQVSALVCTPEGRILLCLDDMIDVRCEDRSAGTPLDESDDPLHCFVERDGVDEELADPDSSAHRRR